MKNIINFNDFANGSAEISEHQLNLFRDANLHQVEKSIEGVETFDDAIDVLRDMATSDSYSFHDAAYAYGTLKRKFPEIQLNTETVRLADSGQGLAAERARKMLEYAKLMANKMESDPEVQKMIGR